MFDLSVILPNYNHARYLPDSLSAIFAQSSPPQEVIVIDDGSVDDSLLVLKELQMKYPNLKILSNQKNLGIHESVNRGIAAAKGKYLAFCSADDYVFPEFFSLSYEAFQKHPDAGLCFGDFATFRPGEAHIEFSLLRRGDPLYLKPLELVSYMKKHQFAINSYVAICRRDLVLKFGGYKKHLTCLADVYLCYQIAFETPIVYVPRVFASQRIIPESYGQRIRRDFNKRTRVWRSFLTEIFESNSSEQFREYSISSRLLGIGGYFILLFLLLHPRYWFLFPSIFVNVIRRKCKS